MPTLPAIFDPAATARDPKEMYQSVSSIDTLVQSGAIVLLDAKWLMQMVLTDWKLPPRQELPPEAIFRGTVDDSVLVVVISYCWASRAHPDPHCAILKEVCELLGYLDVASGWGQEGDPTDDSVRGKKVAVFIDYGCMYQRTAASGITFAQMESFGVGLGGINVLYANNKTVKFLCRNSHLHCTLPDGRASYEDSGWPFFERAVSCLTTPPEKVIDVAPARAPREPRAPCAAARAAS